MSNESIEEKYKEQIQDLEDKVNSLQSECNTLKNQFSEFVQNSNEKVYKYETNFNFISHTFLDYKDRLLQLEQNFIDQDNIIRNIDLLLKFRQEHQQDTFLLKHEFNQLFEIIDKLKDMNAALRLVNEMDVEKAAKRVLNKVFREEQHHQTRYQQNLLYN
ncbi:MAG: hypothetical protein LBR15_08450 [Methanobrevibacter sp.]|jgi:hypothetical protein|nr:hypothetical protein [Candidatus Methanovirga australis]